MANEFTEKLPPQSIEAETSLLGCLMLDKNAIVKVADFLRPEDFYRPIHQEIYQACQELFAKGEPIDLLSVSNRLKEKNLLEEIGGNSYLTELINSVPTASHVFNYAKIIQRKRILRDLISASQEIGLLGYQEQEDVDKLLDLAEKKIFSIAQKSLTQKFLPVKDSLEEAFERIDRLSKKEVGLRGLATGFTDLDNILAGFQKSDLIILASRPTMGKCLAGNTEIVNPNPGSISTIEEIVKNKQKDILTLNKDLKIIKTEVSNFMNNGKKPVFLVKTRLGKEIEATINHPFLTINGWKPLGELKIGERIAMPRKIPVFGKRCLPDYQVKLFAYFLSKGGLIDKGPRFINRNKWIIKDFIESVQFFPMVRIIEESSNSRSFPYYSVSGVEKKSRGELKKPKNLVKKLNIPDKKNRKLIKEQETLIDKNSVTEWLSSVGLMGKLSKEKFIPQIIFTLNKKKLSLFLNRLFSCDGCIWEDDDRQYHLSYSGSSKKLIKQVQHLLLRFGVLSKFREKKIKTKNGTKLVYELEIHNSNSLLTFIREIGIYGNKKKLKEVERKLGQIKPTWAQYTLPTKIWKKILEIKGKKRLKNLVESDIYWDKIVSIRYVGKKVVYDLTVPNTHNFIANDFFTHNSALACNFAANIAINEKIPVGIFSLEMSRDQIVDRLISSISGVDLWRLRTGRLSDQGEDNDFIRIREALGILSETPIYIDDAASATVLQMKAMSRRLQAENGLGLVIIDYLQLMEPLNPDASPVQQVSENSRALKALARELNIPVLAISQLSRAVEQRSPQIPRLADLRESGCLAGDTLIFRADTGKKIKIKDLVGQKDIPIYTLDKDWKLKVTKISKVFPSGKKKLYLLKTQSGSEIRASANHQFRKLEGWSRLDQLKLGDRIALPRRIPQIQNPIEIEKEKVIPLAYLIVDGSYIIHNIPKYPSSSKGKTITQARIDYNLLSQDFATELGISSPASLRTLGKSQLNIAQQKIMSISTVLADPQVEKIAKADIFWDKIISITPLEVEEVYDATVPETHNFVANGIIVHNSIEQDADVVMFIYREDRYRPETSRKGIADIIIAKHRNGPVGRAELFFDERRVTFRNLEKGYLEE